MAGISEILLRIEKRLSAIERWQNAYKIRARNLATISEYTGALTANAPIELLIGGTVAAGAEGHNIGDGFYMAYNYGYPSFYAGSQDAERIEIAAGSVGFWGDLYNEGDIPVINPSGITTWPPNFIRNGSFDHKDHLYTNQPKYWVSRNMTIASDDFGEDY